MPQSHDPACRLSATEDQSEEPPSFEPAPFIYIKIPLAARGMDDALSRDEAIDQALRDRDLGSVLGWGESLGNVQPNLTRAVVFHRIDVEVTDLAAARAALREILPPLGVPPGTEIHYQSGGRGMQDIYSPDGWRLGQPLSGRSR